MIRAISVRQPWAELIIRGDKQVEVRKASTPYRGLLVIHAAASIRNEFRIANFGLEEGLSLPMQSFIGTVELIDVVPLNRERWGKLRKLHLIPGPWDQRKHKYAWILRNPTRVEPMHFKGLPKSFSLNDGVIRKLKLG